MRVQLLKTIGQTTELISDSMSHLLGTTTSTLCHQKYALMHRYGHHRNPSTNRSVTTGNAMVPLESLTRVPGRLQKTLDP